MDRREKEKQLPLSSSSILSIFSMMIGLSPDGLCLSPAVSAIFTHQLNESAVRCLSMSSIFKMALFFRNKTKKNNYYFNIVFTDHGWIEIIKRKAVFFLKNASLFMSLFVSLSCDEFLIIYFNCLI